MAEKFDGELFLGGETPPQVADLGVLQDESDDLFTLVVRDDMDAEINEHVVYERALFKYKDPTSPPHIKKQCAKWIKPGFGSKICVGWTIRYRWLYRIGVVRVTTLSGADAAGILEECLKQSAIAAAVAAIVSGGSAGIPAAQAALAACLTAKLGNKLVGVSLDISSSRGDWE